MNVLVTGHLGYIGCVLTQLLIEHGHDVHGLDSDIYRNCTFVDCVPQVPYLNKDVRDITLDDVTGYDAIIHLAGLSNDPLGDYKPSLTDSINRKGSIRLAELAKAAGVPRFIFASSCSNYGAAGETFLDESAAFNPVTPYGESKVAVEKALLPLADDEFSPTFLRASTAYGVSPRLRFDLVVNNLTAWAFTTGRVYLKSDGTPWRPLVHVEDIARAYVATLEAPLEMVHARAFNVGQTSENYRISDIAEMVEDCVPNSKVEFSVDGGPDKRCYRVDCNLLSRTLHGFKPQWTVERGIRQLYEKYVEVGLKMEDFEGARFQRIAHVKHLISSNILNEEMRWIA
ncbi:NAD-dependent epimerase/dehydratase family protein [Parahaliea mediterranea]|uniref:NAD(P)-dependent oxidoreductase n=1 Tax=Parahaliea mediterranea TaxID=651086 RepID=A0A939IIH4_9GAMM|nr:NAD(P)-dependent oxidoreductase [Parahaliea mediterranea]MBN7795256.1 NAD(P)-dependent oxidoreductase [Parahaliea mediterranea]